MITNNRRVAIIGAGYVGASIAYALTIKNITSEIVLIDVDNKKAEGEALDIEHGISGRYQRKVMPVRCPCVIAGSSDKGPGNDSAHAILTYKALAAGPAYLI